MFIRPILVCICLAGWSGVAPTGVEAEITPSPFWKNQIGFPDDAFVAPGSSSDNPGWVKFTVLMSEPQQVYFQDSVAYPFHYHFATEVLDPFLGMSPEDFDQATLYNEGQQAILGAVIVPPTGGYPIPPPVAEYGIQFVRRDVYTREEIADLFNLVKANIVAEEGVEAFYFPSYEQRVTAEVHASWFATEGIPISSPGRWAQGNACYAQGWALGELKFVTGDQIEAAFRSGFLLPGDVLLTDGAPAEIPLVAGIVSLSPSTPNSHVAILAQSFGVPFVHLALEADAQRAQELLGHRVALTAYDDFGVCAVRLIDVEWVVSDEQIEQILVLKDPPALDIAPMARYGAFSVATDGLLPADIRYFGGKAANFGILRTAIPDHSPVSAAFSFDLWNGFLDQTLVGDKTLRGEIAEGLLGTSYPPWDMALLAADLDAIQELFKDSEVTGFSGELQDAVLATLQDPQFGFDPARKIRFRSSTNMEDSEAFTGTGLYDSFSGCLADDLDGDALGPSLCDAEQAEERGIFRAIRKVFASFYNDNAYLERLRHGVSETEVGMGVVVHHSFPDEIELANGVATLEQGYGPNRFGQLVTQLGAVSVTNPTGGSIPEEVSIYVASSGPIYPSLLRGSNLVPLGGSVMTWQEDYIALTELLVAAADEFALVTGKTRYLLDFEYKKVAPLGELVVKQVRSIPLPDDTASITPFLIGEPTEFVAFQGEYGNVFANHRLKSQWQFETQSLWLHPENLQESFYEQTQLDYMAGRCVLTFDGLLSLWPDAYHTGEGSDVKEGWSFNDLPNPRRYELQTHNIPAMVAPSESPLLTLADFGVFNSNKALTVHAEYDQPLPAWDWTGPIPTTSDVVQLQVRPSKDPGDLLQERWYQGDEVSITTCFYWPPEPPGEVAGYTAPLAHWVETVIEGYTTEPIVLRGDYAQTYRPEHHNISEHFLFEPQLEPDLSALQRYELRQKDIRLIHWFAGFLTTYGYEQAPFNLSKFTVLAQNWLATQCGLCEGADLTCDESVFIDDLLELGNLWLAGAGE